MENYVKKEMFLFEFGYLLDKCDKEYFMYHNVYDKNHAFYDEGQNLFLAEELESYIETAKNYVSLYKNSYVVITNQGLWNLTQKEIENIDFDSLDLSECDYGVENIVYSIMSNEYGNIKENFIKK